jgi:hypothetical protein
MGERAKSARWVSTYGDAKPSELVVMVDSYAWSPCASTAIRGHGVRAPGRVARDARAAGSLPMRPGTTIAVAVLLVLILGAAFAQFVLRLGP